LAYIKLPLFAQAQKSAHSWDSLAGLKAHFSEIPSGSLFLREESLAPEVWQKINDSSLGKAKSQTVISFLKLYPFF